MQRQYSLLLKLAGIGPDGMICYLCMCVGGGACV